MIGRMEFMGSNRSSKDPRDQSHIEVKGYIHICICMKYKEATHLDSSYVEVSVGFH